MVCRDADTAHTETKKNSNNTTKGFLNFFFGRPLNVFKSSAFESRQVTRTQSEITEKGTYLLLQKDTTGG